jgi:hypothetical protein
MFVTKVVLIVIVGQRFPDLPSEWEHIFAVLVFFIDVVCSYGVVATVGASLQRGVIASVVDNVRRTSIWTNLVIALLLSIGFTAGSSIGSLSLGGSYFEGTFRWLLISTVGLWLVLTYICFIMKRVAAGSTSEQSLRRRINIVNALGTLLFCALLPFLAVISFPVSASSLDMHRTVVAALLGSFILKYFLVWIVTLASLGIARLARGNTRCSNCATLASNTLGSCCAQCGAEATPWAIVEWIGEFGVLPDQGEALLKAVHSRSSGAMESLEVQMISELKGEEMTADDVCHFYEEKHSRNQCLDALSYLESVEAIVVEPELKFRDSVGVPETAIIYFPIKTSLKRLG